MLTFHITLFFIFLVFHGHSYHTFFPLNTPWLSYENIILTLLGAAGSTLRHRCTTRSIPPILLSFSGLTCSSRVLRILGFLWQASFFPYRACTCLSCWASCRRGNREFHFIKAVQAPHKNTQGCLTMKGIEECCRAVGREKDSLWHTRVTVPR